MAIFALDGFRSIEEARDEPMRAMYDGVCHLNEIKPLFDFHLGEFVDIPVRSAAARALRRAIFSGKLPLYAVFSSRLEPFRLSDRKLVEAALDSDVMVLSFAYIDQHYRAPFGLSWTDLKELTRNPLCLDEKCFGRWLRSEQRKREWPCHSLRSDARRSQGRPSIIDEVTEIIEELAENGKLQSSMGNKEIHALVEAARPSLRKVSEETVRRARRRA